MTACQAVANIVKSSLGPVGLDKVLLLFLVFIVFYEACLEGDDLNLLFIYACAMRAAILTQKIKKERAAI